MGHDQEDDPGSSRFIKQEPADEGIYASRRERTFSEIFSWHNKTDARGLTLQPVTQSLDPQPTHVVWSSSDEENRRLDTNHGGEDVASLQRDMLSSSVPQNDANDAYSISQAERLDCPSERVPFDPFRSVSPPPSQQPAEFDPFRSVSPPPSQEQAEFDPFRSVSPPAYQQPIDHASLPSQGDEPTLQPPSPKQSGDSVLVRKEQIPDQPAMQLDQQAYRLSRTPSPQQSDCFASDSQTPGRSETPPTPVDFEDCFPNDFTLPDGSFGVLLSNFNPEKATPASEHDQDRGGATIDPNTPMQSIECQPQIYKPPPATVPKSRDYRHLVPNIDSEVTFQEQLRRYMAERGLQLGEGELTTKGRSITQGESLPKSASIGKSESHEKRQHKRSQSANSNSRPSRLDPSSSHKFSTFLHLRDSLPIAALIAMMAPPNQTQVLTNLAELSGLQASTGTLQPASHKLPAAMRSMLDNLMQKLNSDKAFLKSVVTYASEQVMKNYRDGEKPVDPKHILETGLDELSTPRQAREQLLKERTQFHEILSKYESIVEQYKKQNRELTAKLNRKNSTSNAKVERKTIERNGDGSIKHNPFWVCGNLMPDGAMCNGVNQEWDGSIVPTQLDTSTSPNWTLKQICFKCREQNKGNRRYLTDYEAQMFTTLVTQEQTPAAFSPQPQPFPMFQQHIAQPIAMFSQPMGQPVPMFSQPATTMSPMAQYPTSQHPMTAQHPNTQYPTTQYQPTQCQLAAQHPMPQQQMAQHQIAHHPTVHYPMVQHPMAQQPAVRPLPVTPPMVQDPVVRPMPLTPPMVQNSVVRPTRTPIFQTKLAMPQIGPLPSCASPSTPEPKKRKATEAPADSPSPKRHPGFDISPAVQDTLRRELPQKEWMKPKETVCQGPGTSSEPIAIDDEGPAGETGVTEQCGASEDDMVSLFGDDENENENENLETLDDFEAELCAALDEELRKEAMKTV